MIYIANMLFYIVYVAAYYRSNKIVLELSKNDVATAEETKALLIKSSVSPFILLSETLSHCFMSTSDLILKYSSQMLPHLVFEEDDLDRHLDDMENKKHNDPSKLH